MSKNFRIARKPSQASESVGVGQASAAPAEKKARTSKPSPPVASRESKVGLGQTTRKTIEVPEDYFYKVKMRALERKMLEKQLWSEIVQEYFDNHPTL